MGGSGFFSAKTKLVKPEKIEKLVCIDVGRGKDCGFRAAAVAMVDNILAKPRANEDLARKLLKLHQEYFPQPPIAKSFQQQYSLRTPTKRLAMRVETRDVRAKANYLSELAFVLRQVAVDEICDHRLQYRGAFVANGMNEGTSPEKMRRQESWMEECAIAALSKAMQLPIKVQVVAPGKKIPLCLKYTTAKEPIGSSIVMQLQNQHYMPLVNKSDYFTGINKQTIEAVEPVVKPRRKDPELSEILAEIAAEDKRLNEEFEHNKTWLNVLVEDGDITKQDLLAIYIKGLKKSDYLQGRVKHGNQHLFEAINEALNVEPSVLSKEKNHDKEIIEGLVEAIARAISIQHLDPQLVEEAVVKSSVTSEP